MKLNTDLYDPADLTGYARRDVEEWERSKGTLAQFLPNTTVDDISVRFAKGNRGMTPLAEFRAYDAETAIAGGARGERVTVDMPALGLKTRISEEDQLRSRSASAEVRLNTIEATAEQNVRAVANRMELARGQVLATGVLAIDQDDFKATVNFGRDPAMNAVAATLWNQTGATILDDLEAWQSAYVDTNNGEEPAIALVSQKLISTLARSEEFRALAKNSTDVSLVSVEFINDVLSSFGFPRLQKFDRKVGGVRVLPENKILFLPESPESGLGSSTWGVTLEADKPTYGIAEEDRPGIVVGTYENEDPEGIWVRSAAIGMPILANPNLAMVAQVIA